MIPKSIRPMLARTASRPFDSERYIFEIKFNGIRALAFIENKKLRLQSRGLKDLTEKFPEFSQLPKQLLGEGIVLDGEIVIFNQEQREMLGAIQRRIQKTDSLKINYLSKNLPASYLVFDILYLNGHSIMAKPLIERKEILSSFLRPSALIRPIGFIEKEGIRLFNEVKSQGLEGIMAKKKNSPYLPGLRSKKWLKIKVKRE